MDGKSLDPNTLYSLEEGQQVCINIGSLQIVVDAEMMEGVLGIRVWKMGSDGENEKNFPEGELEVPLE